MIYWAALLLIEAAKDGLVSNWRDRWDRFLDRMNEVLGA